MHKFASACGLITLVTLTGCATAQCGDAHAYHSSTIGAPLKAPAGMSAPKPDPAYKIPGNPSATGRRTDLDASGACIVFPPTVVSSKGAAAEPAGDTRPAVQQGAAQPPAASQPGTANPAPASPAPAAASSAKPAVATGGPIG